MKKRIGILICFFCFCVFSGCGTDPDPETVQQEKDRIEKVGDGASKLGYDGEAIKKGLRDVEGLSKDRDQEMEKVFDE